MKKTRKKKQVAFLCVAAAALIVLLASLLWMARRSGGGPAFWIGLTDLLVVAVGGFVAFRQSAIFQAQLEGLIRTGDLEEARFEDPDANHPLYDSEAQELLEHLEERLLESSSATALKVEAELRALQYQINPHFLYNTLEIIRSRAMVQGNSDVCEIVESLAMQFRYCINSSGDMATLQQELDHVHNYMLIQHYRFGDRIRYEMIIQRENEWVLQSKMPVLTLQPIIENALLHGINPKVDGGSITLRVELTSRRLHILIEDDGVGINEADLQKMRHRLRENKAPEIPSHGKRSSGIAMRNVNARIHLYFGENYGVDISSTLGVGTTVIVTLPITCMEGEE